MKKIILFINFLFFLISNAQILSNAEEAFALSVKINKPVFLIFSGSDWCQKCIHFEKKILSDTSFIQFSNENLILLNADFPQRKKLSNEEVKQNEALAESYNPDGLFPRFVLIDSDKKVIATITYNQQTSTDFISELNFCIKKQN